jgi:hypothetical protein
MTLYDKKDVEGDIIIYSEKDVKEAIKEFLNKEGHLLIELQTMKLHHSEFADKRWELVNKIFGRDLCE